MKSDTKEKPSSRFWALFNAACGLITIAGWLGISPDRVGQLAYDVLYPVLPFAAFGFGFFAGFFARDYMKKRDAETAARIRREDAEHAEKMRREREEYEAAKRAAKADAIENEEYGNMLDDAAVQFKAFDIDAKAVVCKAYDNGEFIINFDTSEARDVASYQIERLMYRETLPDGMFRYTLNPMTRDMIDAHPELLNDIRDHMERNQAAKNAEATRANPELMLSHMGIDELQTLQKIVDNAGYLDLAESEGARYDTLAEFGMIGEWTPDPDGHPICELDKDVLAFFEREENKELISQYISYATE